MSRYFTADLHLNHARIIEFTGRPFADVETMNAALVESWNSDVGDLDEVYVFGDLGLGNFERSLELMSELNGVKYLVPGNHDRVFSGQKPAYREQFRGVYASAGFQTLEEQVIFDIGGRQVLGCHFPYAGDSHGPDRYSDLRPTDEGLPLIHGHVHTEWRFRGREYNVGVDVNDFRLVAEAELEAWLVGLD